VISRVSRFPLDQIFSTAKNANQREKNPVFVFPRDPHFISASRDFARFAVLMGSDFFNREKRESTRKESGICVSEGSTLYFCFA
jgi:hypothetical protein